MNFFFLKLSRISTLWHCSLKLNPPEKSLPYIFLDWRPLSAEIEFGGRGGITLLGVKFQGTLPTLFRCTFLMKYSMMPKVIWGHRITLLWLRIFWPYKNLVFHSFVFNFCWKWNLKVQNKLDKLSNLLSRLLLIIKLISYYYIFTNYLVVLNDT